MSPRESLLQRLVCSSVSDLAALLERRKDVTRAPRPRSLVELAQRLEQPASLAWALRSLPLPASQLLEALQALGGRTHRARLRELLAAGGADHSGAVDEVLRVVADSGLVFLGGGDPPGVSAQLDPRDQGGAEFDGGNGADRGEEVTAAAGMSALFPSPLGLGPGLHALLGEKTATELKPILNHLGLPRLNGKEAVLETLVAYLSDPEHIRVLVGALPGHDVAALQNLAWAGDTEEWQRYSRPQYHPFESTVPTDGAAPYDGRYGEKQWYEYEPPYQDEPPYDYAPYDGRYGSSNGRYGGHGQRGTAQPNGPGGGVVEWATDRGLLVGARWGSPARMPAEIALALRGSLYRAPFSPVPPVPALSEVDAGAVENESAAASAGFADHAVAVLDYLARHPVATVKSGGVGVRELTRLAKAVGTQETAARLTLELAQELELLEHRGPAIGVSARFDSWRHADPATRFASLVSSWWHYGGTPTISRGPTGLAVRALEIPAQCLSCRETRRKVIAAVAGIGGGVGSDCASITSVALWSDPYLHLDGPHLDGPHLDGIDPSDPLSLLWREAETLGVIARGAISALGRLLLAGDLRALTTGAAELLPPAGHLATFGADLTVLVVGSPSAAVSRLLDSAADRESRGGAVIWRFTPISVRRAMDAGIAATDLAESLRGISTSGELPQSLEYLINDVGRRHGALRLQPAESIVRSDDEALLAEVAADRTLARLGFRLIAPTVLVSSATSDAALKALRDAGYFPMPDDVGGRPELTPGPSPVNRSSPDPAGDPGGSQAQIPPLDQTDAPEGWWPAVPTLPSADAGIDEDRAVDAFALATTLLATPTAARPPERTLTESALVELNCTLTPTEIRQLAYAIETQHPVLISYRAKTGSTSTRIISGLDLDGDHIYAWCELRQAERVFAVAAIQSATATE